MAWTFSRCLREAKKELRMPITSASALARMRILLNEAAPAFFLDADINGWIAEAALDISSKSGCVECLGTLALTPNTIAYAEPGAFTNPTPSSASATLSRVHAALYQNIALVRVHPRMFGNANADTTGNTPRLYAHFGDLVYLYPVGGGAAGTVTLLCSIEVDVVEDLPYEWQHLVYPYALYRAKQKDERWAEAASVYAEYVNGLAYQTNALLERGVSSRADLLIPDQLVTER